MMGVVVEARDGSERSPSTYVLQPQYDRDQGKIPTAATLMMMMLMLLVDQ